MYHIYIYIYIYTATFSTPWEHGHKFQGFSHSWPVPVVFLRRGKSDFQKKNGISWDLKLIYDKWICNDK